MNNQLHIHQKSPQHGDKSISNWQAWGISCLLATLIVLSPMGLLFWVMQKGYHEARSAQDESKRTVNPDELRAWAWMQIKKHPEGGYIKVSAGELPETLSHFSKSRGLYLHLDPSEVNRSKRDDLLRALLVWNFSAGYSMSVTVWLNADGTAAEIDDAQAWAKGITTTYYGK